MKRVYLAGDIVFRPDADAIYDRMRAICAEHGLSGAAPVDGQIDLHGLPPGEATILEIVRADLALMDHCDAGLFCLDPFRRAADMDPGTAVEIGYMFAHGKMLSAYTTDGRGYPDKVAAYFRNAWQGELRPRAAAAGVASGALEDPDGIMAHSEGFAQNGMTEGLIRLSGGRVFADADLFVAFERAAADLAERLSAVPP